MRKWSRKRWRKIGIPERHGGKRMGREVREIDEDVRRRSKVMNKVARKREKGRGKRRTNESVVLVYRLDANKDRIEKKAEKK